VIAYLPDNKKVHHALGTSLMFMGHFEEANPHIIEWIVASAKDLNFQVWRGENLTGKTLYVFADNGLGDIIRGVRFLPAIAQTCDRLILNINPNLRRLIGNIPNVEMRSDPPPSCDYYTTTYVLPHVVGIDPVAYSRYVPYLHAEPDLVSHWRALLPKKGFRIGICWQSGAPAGEGRAISLSSLAPLARLPGVTLISLQMAHGLDQLDHLPDGMTVTTLGPSFNNRPDNFIDTAAVMKSLDLIISVDTSVAHLAGALGFPVWLLLETITNFQWLQGRDDSFWYPTMRLFRQKTYGEWGDVITHVEKELSKLITGTSH